MTTTTSRFSHRSLHAQTSSSFVPSKRWSNTIILVAISILILTSARAAKAQSSIHGSTPASMAPGAPAGSYVLTGFENVNLYNGNLNFHLPLLPVRGRGESGYTITLPIEARWVAEGNIGFGGFSPSFNWWTGIKPGYSPGILQGRQVGVPCDWGQQGSTDTATRLTFTANDGTEYELLDTQFGGYAASSECNFAHPGTGTMASRGNTFISIDGTSATFISDAPILDNVMAGEGALLIYPSGSLYLADGTRYQINKGRVVEIRDRNGNVVSFEYENPNFWARIVSIKDSLDRQINISYWGGSVTFDQITFKGFGGQDRAIKIGHTNLGNALIAGESVSSYPTLFPQLVTAPTQIHDPEVIAYVTLPNQKSYQFRYNRYGELAKVELPTGGRYEYIWGSGYQAGDPSGTNGAESQIIRRVLERWEYSDATTLVGKTTFGKLIPNGSPTTEGSVVVKSFTPSDQLLAQTKHYFKVDFGNGGMFALPPPLDGRETKTENLALDGSVLLRTSQNWTTGGVFFSNPTNPRIAETVTTLVDTNQVSKQSFLYDGFNNRTDTYEFAFGTGTPGPRLRHTHLNYLNSTSYTNANVHIRDRVTQISIFDGPDGAEKERSRTVYEYDDYSNTTNHAQLIDWQTVTGISMSGQDSAFGTSYETRGNVTKTTQFLLVADPTTNPAANQGSGSTYSQYDVAGNVVKTIDSLGNQSTIEYPDRFGSPDGEAQSNSSPSNLSSPVLKYTYAFPTRVTNALGQISFNQFDYYLGQSVDNEDINGVVSSASYSDLMDRPTQVILGNNPSANAKSQTTFEYNDNTRTVTRRSAKETWNDGLLVTESLYDGLGRVIEQKNYETASSYIVTQTQYDAAGRPFKFSNPYRPLSEGAKWTIQTFDPLGRLISVMTPDNAVATMSYSGNTVTVTDPAGRVRKSVNDAHGRLVEVYEDPSVLNYQTVYSYNTLDSLVKVTQGSQLRFFMYDSLKRLIRSRNPEHGTLAGLALSDPITGNGSWSVGYQYDSNSNLTQKTDPRGVTSTYVYDVLNRNTTIDYSDTPSISPDMTRIYDGAVNGKGRIWKSYAGGTETTGSNVERTVVDNYDSLGLPLVLTQSFKLNNEWKAPYQTTRVYNVAGAVTSQTYPSGHVVNYNYDNAGRLADKDANNLAFTGRLGDGALRTYSRGITYASAGQLQHELFGSNTAVHNNLFYNSRQQLAEILVNTTGGSATYDRGRIINSYSLQCSGANCEATDNNGNLRKQQIDIPTTEQATSYASWYQQYEYDNLNRLKSVREVAGSNQLWRQWFSYDRWGNRTIDTTQDSGDPNPRTYGTGINNKAFEKEDATNRLYSPGDLSLPDNQKRITYDLAGNQTKDVYTGYGTATFNADNQITTITDKDGGTATYTYNADGQRTRRKIANQETWQIYGMEGELLAEYPQSGATDAPQKEYGYRNGQLLVVADANGVPIVPEFNDDFNDNSLSTVKWSVLDPNSPAVVSEQNQQLQISLAPSTATYNGIVSVGSYSMEGKMVQLEAPQVVSQAGWVENALMIQKNATNYFLINVGAANILFRSVVNGVNDQLIIPYNSASHRFWRVRHDQTTNTVAFETSGNGTGWATQKTVNVGFVLTGLKFQLHAGAYGTGNASPGATKYDDFKLVNSQAAFSTLSVSNFGFETPTVGAGLWQFSPSGGSWTFASGAGLSGNGSAFTSGNPSAPEGSQVAFLQGTLATITQSVSGFQSGVSYSIIFKAAQRGNCCNAGGQDFQVYVDNQLLGSFHPISTSYLDYDTPAFTVSAGAHTIKFAAVNPLGGDHTAFIDNVRIVGSANTSNGIQWLVSDQLGTPRMAIDQTGSVAGINRHDYLPFGEELHSQLGLRTESLGYSAGDGVRQQFTQKERDIETGLDYFLARYYSATQGRFTSPDEFTDGPVELFNFADNASKNPTFYADLRKPQSLNKYQYSYNNPLRWVDPDGHDPEEPEPPQDPRPVVPIPGPIPGAPPLPLTLPTTSTSKVPNDATIIEGGKTVLDTVADYTGISALADWLRPKIWPTPAPAPAPAPGTGPTTDTQQGMAVFRPVPIETRSKETLNRISSQFRTAATHINKINSSDPNDPNRHHWKKEIKAALDKAERLSQRLKNTPTMQKAVREIVSQLRRTIE